MMRLRSLVWGCLRRGARGAGRASLPLVLCTLLTACGSGTGNDDSLGASGGVRPTFVADPTVSPNCPRAGGDLVSMQGATATGSVVNVDLVLTDCDSSIELSGLSFEISFDDSFVGFIGCSPGSLLPPNRLAPGTPECVAVGASVLGTIALPPPDSTRVTSGRADIVRLTFIVTRKGVTSPLSFTGLDSENGSSVFFVDPLSPTAIVRSLGPSGYAGGSIISN